jgi:hypothetical protein
VESPVLCFAVAAMLAVTGPAKAGHYRNEAMVVAQAEITDARDAALVSPETIVELDLLIAGISAKS